ncbi:MAG: ATP-dependent Clp protease adaptor ClpS, partial [Thermocrispum sp.]
MDEGRQWTVLLCDDEVNSVTGVLYVLNRVCGLSPQAGLLVGGALQGAGSHELRSFARREPAEALAAELLLYGLH